MKINDCNGLKYVTFDNISATGLVNHAFSTRVGGVSEGCFDSLNLGLSRGDVREHVQENYRRISRAVGFNWNNAVFSNQSHEINVHRATAQDRGNGVTRPTTVRDTDGFVTNVENVVLQTFHADCVPVFLVDPVRRAAGLAHAGWKGTLREVAAVTLRRMTAEFGTDPADVLAGLGPGVGPEYFLVDADVAERFHTELPFSAEFTIQHADKLTIDLWKVNRRSLENAGVKPSNIEDSGLCTYTRADLFYSHRRMGATDRGAMAAFIEIRVCE
ncbi:MAG: peptidoglycan editing factor PgeF [Defluviitaleaceae bacterium]|nr:peptidoglycan editing factor PgeF [Defluviitaleaceae bacterium]